MTRIESSDSTKVSLTHYLHMDQTWLYHRQLPSLFSPSCRQIPRQDSASLVTNTYWSGSDFSDSLHPVISEIKAITSSNVSSTGCVKHQNMWKLPQITHCLEMSPQTTANSRKLGLLHTARSWHLNPSTFQHYWGGTSTCITIIVQDPSFIFKGQTLEGQRHPRKSPFDGYWG